MIFIPVFMGAPFVCVDIICGRNEQRKALLRRIEELREIAIAKQTFSKIHFVETKEEPESLLRFVVEQTRFSDNERLAMLCRILVPVHEALAHDEPSRSKMIYDLVAMGYPASGVAKVMKAIIEQFS